MPSEPITISATGKLFDLLLLIRKGMLTNDRVSPQISLAVFRVPFLNRSISKLKSLETERGEESSPVSDLGGGSNPNFLNRNQESITEPLKLAFKSN